MGLKEQGLQGSLWNMTSMLIAQLRNFIVSIILARLLSPEDFGVIGMAMAFAAVVDSFVDFGFSNAIIQKGKVSEVQESTVFYINLIMGVVLMVVMFSLSPYIALYFKMPVLSSIVKTMSFVFVIKAFEGLQMALFKKELDFKTPFKVNLASGITSGIIGITLAYCGFGVWALVYSQISGWIMSVIMIWCLSKWRPSLQFDLKEVKELWLFGYKYSLSILIDSLFTRLDTLIIGRVFSAATLGFFYRAKSLNKLVVQYSFNAFSGVLFPSLSKLSDNIEQLRHNVLRLIQATSFLTFLFSGLMYLCSTEVIVILFGEKWIDAVPFFNILGLFSFCFTIPTVLVVPLLSIGKAGLNLKIEILKKILTAISIPIGLYYGIYGYVYAVHIAAIIGMLLNMSALKHINLSIKEQVKNILIYMLPFVLIIITVKNTERFIVLDNLYLMLCIKALIYSTLYILYNVIRKTEGYIAILNIIQSMIGKKNQITVLDDE